MRHRFDRDRARARGRSHARPGRFFFSSTICLKNLQGNLRWLAFAARVLPFLPTVGSFSVDDLKRRMASAGFAIEETFEQSPGVVFLVAVKQ